MSGGTSTKETKVQVAWGIGYKPGTIATEILYHPLRAAFHLQVVSEG